MAEAPMEVISRPSSEPDTVIDSVLAGDDDDDVTVTINDQPVVLTVDAAFDVITPAEADEIKQAAEKRAVEAAAAPPPPTVYKKRKGQFGKRRRRGRPSSAPKAEKPEKQKDEPPKPPPEALVEAIEAPAHPKYEFGTGQEYYTYTAPSADYYDTIVEYDLDEQDRAWLKLLKEEHSDPEAEHARLGEETLELLMDRFEKHSLYKELASQSKRKRKRGKPPRNPPPMTSTTALQPKLPPGIVNMTHEEGTTPPEDLCAVCLSDEASNTNSIVFCDRCNVGVHQECYGVPHIPEGQWHCKKCRDAPGTDVKCALCSMEGGAFLPAESDKGKKWVHAACAKWVPETNFANPSFLEPVRDLDDVPQDRFKMTCYVCNRKNGACIQCMKKNCYQAFHVTCAVQAHLTMRYEHDPAHDQVVPVYYCHKHTPADAAHQPIALHDLDPDVLVAFKHHESIAGPSFRLTIPQVIYEAIAREADVNTRSRMLEQVKNYWMMKRYSRQGAPLLRRLQANASLNRESKKMKKTRLIRKDLEKLRLLAGQTLRREKIKRELIQNLRNSFFKRSDPMTDVFQYIVDEAMKRDSMRIFQAPVDPAEFPNYYVEIDEPMDLSTMQTKVDNGEYDSFADIVHDILLIPDNCFLFNDPGSWWQDQAKLFLFRVQAFLERLAIQLHLAGVDLRTGQLVKPMMVPPVATPQVPVSNPPTGHLTVSLPTATEAVTMDTAPNVDVDPLIKADPSVDESVSTEARHETEQSEARVAEGLDQAEDVEQPAQEPDQLTAETAEVVQQPVEGTLTTLEGSDDQAQQEDSEAIDRENTVATNDNVDSADMDVAPDTAAKADMDDKADGDDRSDKDDMNGKSSPSHTPNNTETVETAKLTTATPSDDATRSSSTGQDPSSIPAGGSAAADTAPPGASMDTRDDEGQAVTVAETTSTEAPLAQDGKNNTTPPATEPPTATELKDHAGGVDDTPKGQGNVVINGGPKTTMDTAEAVVGQVVDLDDTSTVAMVQDEDQATLNTQDSSEANHASIDNGLTPIVGLVAYPESPLTDEPLEDDDSNDVQNQEPTTKRPKLEDSLSAPTPASAIPTGEVVPTDVPGSVEENPDTSPSANDNPVMMDVAADVTQFSEATPATAGPPPLLKPPPPSSSPTPDAIGPDQDMQDMPVRVETGVTGAVRRGRPKSKKAVKVAAIPLSVKEGVKPHEDEDIIAGLDLIFDLASPSSPTELEILEKLADIRVKNQHSGTRASNVSKLAKELFMYRETVNSRCNASNRHRHVVKSKSKRAMIETDHVAELWGFVWAKMKGYPFYPALMVDPDNANPKFPTFVPSASVLKARPRSKTSALVCFFDGTGSWAWLNPDNIKPMFADPELDSNVLSMAPGSHAANVANGHKAAVELHKESTAPVKSKAKAKSKAERRASASA
eukprot:m.243259 g.243259  ORF g.243259 m.243259 type:complete len:1416 (+) comp17461_c0_seq2:46-4293(+)